MRIYISGPITGTKDFMERFAEVEEKLKWQGHMVYNPAKANSYMPEGTTYEEYMEVSFTLLKMADTIYMMSGWEESRGARMELAYAEGMGYRIIKGQRKEEENGQCEKENDLSVVWSDNGKGGGRQRKGTT